jgi:signal transduction histidine kinase
MPDRQKDVPHAQIRYEILFSIFLVVLAFLYRDNTQVIYPDILVRLALFLALNLGISLFLRLWPSKEWVAAVIITANCGVITSVIAASGGPESNLWVLYLLPIFTVCMLLKGREVAWITLGVICFNLAFHFRSMLDESWDAGAVFNLGIRTGLFVFSAAAIWHMSSKTRWAHEKMAEERKKIAELEDSMYQQQTQANQLQKMADIGQLTSGVTHDLNNPMTVIYGSVKLLLEDVSSFPQIKPDLDRILRSTELCRTILGNLLNFARNQSLEQVPCKVHDILESAISLYETTLNQSGIKVEKHYCPLLPDVSASTSQLQRVFLNLMANAKGALLQGGIITFTTEMTALTPQSIGDGVVITVEDNGPGLPEGVLKNMFKPFNSTKEPGKGTGLGLYLAKEIISQHGGTFRVQNGAGGGARFTITLPAYETARPVPVFT